MLLLLNTTRLLQIITADGRVLPNTAKLLTGETPWTIALAVCLKMAFCRILSNVSMRILYWTPPAHKPVLVNDVLKSLYDVWKAGIDNNQQLIIAVRVEK